MKTLALAFAALVLAAPFAGPASAAALVPGSDHGRDAADDRAAHSVVPAEPGAVRETLSYGYPLAGTGASVPGSDTGSRARDGAAIDSVASAPRAPALRAAPRLRAGRVPSSDAD